MNPLRSPLAKHTRRQPPLRPRPTLERLEDRTVPTTLSVADVTVREGPANLGVLDPSGASSVGINDILGITFANDPSHPHYGDLFVTGASSKSIARFDAETQTYQAFVASDSSINPRGIVVGPDGNVYVTDPIQHSILRYDGTTGAPLPAAGQPGSVFVPAGSGGLSGPSGIDFGPDGNVYVTSGPTNKIFKYQGPAGPSPGASLGVFVSVTNGSSPTMLAFGPDGNLYVSLYNGNQTPNPYYGQINRYDGTTGDPIGSGVFVPLASGGLLQPRGLAFDADGTNLYVAVARTGNGVISDLPGLAGEVLRFQGPNGPNPGTFIEAYVTAGQSELTRPVGLARDAAGNLYVGDRNSADVKRFTPGSQATFTVSLDAPSASQVSVDFTTANSTAAAGSDYTAAAGTLVFAPGETTKTVVVPIRDDFVGESTEAVLLNLSNPVNATLADGQGVGTILDNETKFYVVDSGTVKTYEYGSGGTSEEITIPQASSNTAPRGAASTAAGDKVWVVDANKTVYVYNNHGVQLGSWTAGGLHAQAQVEGIATNGTDVWLVDNKQDKVFKYTGAAARLSGSQTAASSFNLNSGNSTPKDVVTDGTSLWVVDDGSVTNKVFKYTVSGSLLGSWAIDAANASPTGITINPANVSDIWIVDNGSLKVHQYTAAASRTSGSQSASVSFALNPFNTNPQGIADPPAAGMLMTATTTPPPAVRIVAPRIRAAALPPVTLGADWYWLTASTPRSDGETFSRRGPWGSFAVPAASTDHANGEGVEAAVAAGQPRPHRRDTLAVLDQAFADGVFLPADAS